MATVFPKIIYMFYGEPLGLNTLVCSYHEHNVKLKPTVQYIRHTAASEEPEHECALILAST